MGGRSSKMALIDTDEEEKEGWRAVAMKGILHNIPRSLRSVSSGRWQ